MDAYSEKIYSDDPLTQHCGIIGIRKIISEPEGYAVLIDQIIEKGLVPKILEFAKQ